MLEHATLWGLALSGFVSSTLLPGGSEVLFVYLVNQAKTEPSLLFITVTFANALGSWVTYAMGWYAAHFKRLQLSPNKHPRVQAWLKRYGVWGLFFAWLPVVGDPLCLLAGWLRLPVFISAVVILLGKAARYASLWWLTVSVASV